MQKLNLYFVEEKLAELHKQIFTPQDLILFFNATKRAVDGFLSYNTVKKKIIRLKHGFYCLKKGYVSPFLIANKLYQPSYLSFETALSFHHLIPETVYAVISATPKATREFAANGIAYIYHKIKQEAFTGYVLEKIEDNLVYIATPEKAVADYGYFVYLKKKSWNDRMDLEKINLSKLKQYLKLFQKEKLIPFLKQYIPHL